MRKPNRTITISFSQHLLERLSKETSRQKLNRATLIREAVEVYLNSKEYERAEYGTQG